MEMPLTERAYENIVNLTANQVLQSAPKLTLHDLHDLKTYPERLAKLPHDVLMSLAYANNDYPNWQQPVRFYQDDKKNIYQAFQVLDSDAFAPILEDEIQDNYNLAYIYNYDIQELAYDKPHLAMKINSKHIEDSLRKLKIPFSKFYDFKHDIPVHVLFLNKDKQHVMQQVASDYSSMDDSFNSIMEDMFDYRCVMINKTYGPFTNFSRNLDISFSKVLYGYQIKNSAQIINHPDHVSIYQDPDLTTNSMHNLDIYMDKFYNAKLMQN